MKKKKRLLLVAKILVGILLIFVIARYGWRLFGFSMCNDKKSFEVLNVGEDEVSFKVMSQPNGIPCSFIGYTTERKGEKIYVGVKFNTILGVLPTDKGTGYFSVPVDERINQIIYKGFDDRIIWDREGKDKFTILLEMDTDIDMEMVRAYCYLGDELITKNDYAYEGTVIPLNFSISDFPMDADLSKLKIKFYALNNGNETKIGDFDDFVINWGQTYDVLITKDNGTFTVYYSSIGG